jgi:4-alpha-glucanotransferase
MPFYLSYESADVWTHPEIFKLNAEKKPVVVAGVPPDYFSKEGQLWGNPVYKWSNQNCIFDWWIKRIVQSLKLVDMLRLDHFRGFIASWQVPAADKTAKNGHWVRSPSEKFFVLLTNRFANLPFIAEDLGTITPKVEKIITELNLPRMKVLLFAFDSSRNNPYLPANYDKNSVVFTGTHDTNTARGWFTQEASLKQKNTLFNLIGKHIPEDDVHWEFIKLAQNSRANLSIIPAQDILGLGSEARMNNPAASSNNWNWQLTPEQFLSKSFQKFGEISYNSNR